MPSILLETIVYARPPAVFDLARDVDFHQRSAAQTGEVAVGGVTAGLLELGDSVTWRATHFGVRQKLTAKITEFDRPRMFVDEMVSGAFKSFRHEHRFEAREDGMTLMTDVFTFASPFGLIGSVVDSLFLKRYMQKFLETRNRAISEHFEVNSPLGTRKSSTHSAS